MVARFKLESPSYDYLVRTNENYLKKETRGSSPSF